MGIYLNSRSAYTLYRSETQKPYFVDKSKMLEELFPFVKTGNNHICITRPRRFGKTKVVYRALQELQKESAERGKPDAVAQCPASGFFF